jgi:hypothetical protein
VGVKIEPGSGVAAAQRFWRANSPSAGTQQVRSANAGMAA